MVVTIVSKTFGTVFFGQFPATEVYTPAIGLLWSARTEKFEKWQKHPSKTKFDEVIQLGKLVLKRLIGPVVRLFLLM